MTRISTGRLARTYGRAIFEACSHDQFDSVSADIAKVQEILQVAPEIREALTSPILPPDQKVAFVEELAPRLRLGNVVFNLLRILAERGRIAILDEVSLAFARAVHEFRELLAVEVVVARSISDSETRDIQEQLKEAVHPALSVSLRVDPSLIGGVVVRSGDNIFDASVKTRLERIRSIMSSPATGS